jgi:hypothetical protein
MFLNQIERWYPAADGGNIVGKFVDAPRVNVKASEEARKNVYEMVPVLLSKAPGSVDVSSQPVKPFNKAELTSRFPQAWEAYEQIKAARASEHQSDEPSRCGITPLEKADFLPRDKLPWLHDLGFSSIEQLASMSDMTMHTMGRGAATWRKKAQDFLKRT